MELLEIYGDNGFIYHKGSITLKGYFFQQTHQSWDFFYFQGYERDVISCQYSHLVCATHIKLIEIQSKKKLKIKKWKMSKADHVRIIEDGIPLGIFLIELPNNFFSLDSSFRTYRTQLKIELPFYVICTSAFTCTFFWYIHTNNLYTCTHAHV